MEANSPQVQASATTISRVDVRVVLFTVSDGRLWIALEKDRAGFRLPAKIPIAGDALDVVATQLLADQLGAVERYLEQLYTLSAGDGDDWTVTVAYLGLARPSDLDRPLSDAEWFDSRDLPEMWQLDLGIAEYAILRLRAKLGYTTIAFHLLPRSFSMSELQHVYEAVLDRPLDKRNFRRRIQSEGFLEATDRTRREGSHRPARLYRFRAAHDAETYLIPAWAARSDGEKIDT